MISRFLLSGTYELRSAIESVIVIAEISGTVLLARKKILGWYSYMLMSMLAGILVMFINPTPAVILGLMELGSLYFYYQGLKTFKSKK